MSLKDDIEKIEKKAKNIEAESFAKTFLEEFKKTNQRLFGCVIFLFIIILLLLAYSGYVTYLYVNTGIETITESVDIENEDGEANGCIGDYCNNG